MSRPSFEALHVVTIAMLTRQEVGKIYSGRIDYERLGWMSNSLPRSYHV